MSSPIKPNAVRETIASLDGDFCEKFIGSLNAPALFVAWYKWKRKSDGTLTDEFKAMFCLATADTGGDPTTPPVTPPVVTPPATPSDPVEARPPPPLVYASRGTYAAMIRVQFSVTGLAPIYAVLRDGQVVKQINVGTGSLPMYDDHLPAGRAHTYVVIAIAASGLTSFPSDSAFGYTQGYAPGQILFP